MSQANRSNSTKIPVQSLSRREAVGLSLGGVVAIAAGGAALASTPDPIFAAIEAHKAAHHRFSRALDVSASLYPSDPRHDQAQELTGAAGEALESAGIHLTDVLPTSFAGVIALLSYVDDFNCGKIGHSEHYLWPDEIVDENVLDENGDHLALPFPFWIMRNVHRTLQGLAV